MEGKFKIKFDSKESYLKGIKDFMSMLNSWKETEGDKFNREYNVEPVEENENYSLRVSLNVTRKDLQVV